MKKTYKSPLVTVCDMEPATVMANSDGRNVGINNNADVFEGNVNERDDEFDDIWGSY